MKHILIALLLSSPALAQTAKTPIEIGCNPKEGDMVGANLCTAVRDAVATSPRYIEVNANPKGYRLRVTTIPTNDKQATAASVVLTWDDYYMSNLVQTCGSGRIAECAQGLVSSFDEDITSLEKQVDDLHASAVKQ
jgi:hypothetical protein